MFYDCECVIWFETTSLLDGGRKSWYNIVILCFLQAAMPHAIRFNGEMSFGYSSPDKFELTSRDTSIS